MQMRPVWAEISIERLLRNYHLLREQAGDAGLIAIVKANAYGHGNTVCAAALHGAGARWLGVTSVDEGSAVRGVCGDARILIMSGIWDVQDASTAIAKGLTPVVWEPAHIGWLETAAGLALTPKQSVAVHLEIDTGMARQGAWATDLSAVLDRLKDAKHLSLEGVMTHFHSPEFLDGDATAVQTKRFDEALETIRSKGFRPSVIHAGNSATALASSSAASVVRLAEKYGAAAMLRPGLSLYGYAPRFSGPGAADALQDLQPVLSWKTRVISLRTIEAGESAGYCATFRASRKSRLALLPVGYADGLNRLLSNHGEVLVRGQRAPIAGRISMDLTIIDVTDVDGVELGEEVVLIGEQQGTQGSELRAQGAGSRNQITAYDLADLTGTIPYEVLCGISARVPRMIVDSGASDA
jgi:alanine racemase